MNTQIELIDSLPVIPVSGIAAAMAFYSESLGFTVEFQQGDYAGVARGTARLHLDGVVNAGAGKVTARINIRGVDELYAELVPRGVVDPAEPLNTKPWGARQFSVLDDIGNRITFVEGA